MSKATVARLLDKALQDPQKRASEDAYQRQVAEEQERDDREEYGDAPVDERKKWEALSRDVVYLIILRSGKALRADVALLGSPEIVDDGKYRVDVELTFPKVCRRDGYPSLDWDRNVTVRTTNIVHIEPVAHDWSRLEVEQYKSLKARGATIAATLANSAPF